MGVARGALVYVVLAFAAGFVLGPIRELFLVPRIGPAWAVAVEGPIMIVVSWLAARFVLARMPGPRTLGRSGLLGGLAVVFLLLIEMATSRALRGWDVGQWLDHLTATPAGLISIALYALFGLMPIVVTALGRGRGAPSSPSGTGA